MAKKLLPEVKLLSLTADDANRLPYAIPDEVDIVVLCCNDCTTTEEARRRMKEIYRSGLQKPENGPFF